MRRAHAYKNELGYDVVDWYWQVREHQPKHYGCKLLDNGLCATKVVRYEDWNRGTEQWELEPMINAATPEQCKVLNSK